MKFIIFEMNCLDAIVLPWPPISTRVNYESFSNRYNGRDSLAMLTDSLTFKITSDSFNLRW